MKKYRVAGKEESGFVIKGEFDTQKEALDFANKLNKISQTYYYDWYEIEVPSEEDEESNSQIRTDYIENEPFKLKAKLTVEQIQDLSTITDEQNKELGELFKKEFLEQINKE